MDISLESSYSVTIRKNENFVRNLEKQILEFTRNKYPILLCHRNYHSNIFFFQVLVSIG